MLKILILTISVLNLSACSLIQMSPDRLYQNYETEQSFENSYNPRYEKKNRRIASVKQELRLNHVNDLSWDQKQKIHQHSLLKKLEEQLPTDIEKRQYYTHQPHFRSNFEKIDFLRQPGFEAKERWLQRNNFPSTFVEKNSFSNLESSMVQESDVAIGMSEQAVLSSWGDPDVIEVAGDPIYKNERWLYTTYVPTPDGFVPEKRVLYFEGGRISSWEKR